MERLITSFVVLCFGIGLPIAHALGLVNPACYAMFTPGTILLGVAMAMDHSHDYGFGDFLRAANRVVLMVTTVVYAGLTTHYMRNSEIFLNGAEMKQVVPGTFTGEHLILCMIVAMLGVVTFGLGKLLRDGLRRKPVNMFAAI